MKKKKTKKTPESEVAKFWDTHDATEALDLSVASQIETIYTPQVKLISLRLPVPLLNRIKQTAAHMDVAYQNLIKVWLTEKVKEENRSEA